MFKVLDQQKIRFLTVFGEVTRISASDCFMYNNKVVFAVPQAKLSMAIGQNANNIREIGELILRRTKVVALPRPGNEADIASFVSSIIHPVQFKNLEVTNEEILISANGMENKAEMMGRNKVRLKELQDIAKQYFNKNLRII